MNQLISSNSTNISVNTQRVAALELLAGQLKSHAGTLSFDQHINDPTHTLHGRIMTTETDLQTLTTTLATLSNHVATLGIAPEWQQLTSVTHNGSTSNWVSGSDLLIDGFGAWQPASVCIHSLIDANGDPVYRCELRGQIRSNTGSFAGNTQGLLVIPINLRPKKSQLHVVRAQVGETIGSIHLSSNGAVNVNDINANEGYLHLEGISWTTN
jgi:hypothetical protein